MRARGEGSVIKRKMRRRDGGTYTRFLAAVTLPPGPDGKRRRVYGPLRATRPEASADLSSLRAQVAAGGEPDKEPLADYLRAWLKGKADLKVRARDTYESDIENHIIPAIGAVRLCDLKPAHVFKLVDGVRETSVSAARKARAVLHAALEDAMRQERIIRNPVAVVPAPKAPAATIARWQTAHAAAFAREAKKHDLTGPVFLTCLAAGLRIGEALGLMWDDLDSDGTLTISRQLLTVGMPRFDTPKTKKGARKLRLGRDAVGMLTDHRLTLQRLGLLREVDVPWVDGPGGEVRPPTTGLLMFPDPRGLPWRLETLRDRYNEIIAAAGVPRVRIHDLRHFHLSRLVALGHDPATVSRRAGHSRTSTTMDIYVDAFEDRMLSAGVELTALLTDDQDA